MSQQFAWKCEKGLEIQLTFLYSDNGQEAFSAYENLIHPCSLPSQIDQRQLGESLCRCPWLEASCTCFEGESKVGDPLSIRDLERLYSDSHYQYEVGRKRQGSHRDLISMHGIEIELVYVRSVELRFAVKRLLS